ncbi:MAG: Holliday junction branch migration protein RuvA [Lachnospiraceae bacterium]|nr:Holliday junction branch migration protein RuvA [Lachnospiraceae bacterium]
MIAHVNGILDDIYEDRVVVDVNGLGINVFVSTRTLSELPGTGSEIKLYTYTAVREDAFNLYGFTSKEDLFIFKKLITVNGVGPKGAMGVLSVLGAEELKYAILSGDPKIISSAPGIGKKTAERIILDLKDKLDWDSGMINKEIGVQMNKGAVGAVDDPIKADAIKALMALGYNSKEASSAVIKTDTSGLSDVESILKEALKYLI